MEIKKELTEKIISTLKSDFDLDINSSQVEFERPQDESHGDWSTNIAMVLSKELKKNPREIAQTIVDSLGNIEEIEKIEIAGPGFINFTLDHRYFQENLKKLLSDGSDFGKGKIKNQNIVVEYSSPNIAKPFSIAHLRSTIIGDAVANILEFSGYKVFRDNHLGDWGTQFGKLIYAIKEWGNIDEIKSSENPIKELVNLYVKFHVEADKDKELETRGREWFKKLEDGDKEARELWQICIDLSFKEFNRIYEILDIHFTENDGKGYGESFFEDKMGPVIKELEEKKLLKDSQGAKIIEFPNEEYPPLMILKSDRATLYATRDLATDKFRLEKYGKDVIVINEVGAEQSLYWQQVFKAEELLGWYKPGQRVHKSHGLYRLKEGKMSTRKGKIIWLQDVLDEAITRAKKVIDNNDKEYNQEEIDLISKTVGVGALKWNDLKRQSHLNIEFDWDQILNLEGNTSSYQQYTYARAKSILRDSKENKFDEIPEGTLSSKYEQAVLKWLERFPETVELAAKEYAPNHIANYLFELAQRFNSFYKQHPVLKAEKESDKQARILLTQATATVIQNGLNLLGIKTVEKM